MREGWWVVNDQGKPTELRMKAQWTEREVERRGLKLTIVNKKGQPSNVHNEALAQLIRLWWTVAAEGVSERDVGDLIKGQLLMQGVEAASVVMLSPMKIQNRVVDSVPAGALAPRRMGGFQK